MFPVARHLGKRGRAIVAKGLEEVIPGMKKKHNEKLLDLFTGVVIGAFIGLYHPMGQYHMILMAVGVFLGLRFVIAVK